MYLLLCFVSTDIDECSMELDGCTQLCTNTYGSYYCSCYSGYQLSNDNITCQGIFIIICTLVYRSHCTC